MITSLPPPCGLDPLIELGKIRGMVFSQAPSWIDREALIQDIWLESWVCHRPLTALLVRHRIANLVRDTITRHESPLPEEAFESSGEVDPSDCAEQSELVSLLISRASLSGRETRTLSLLFWSGLTLAEAGRLLGVSTQALRQSRDSALSKIRTQTLLETPL